MFEVSPKAKISRLADIEISTRGTHIVINDGVVIDAFVKIKSVGGFGDLIIGKNSYINSGTVIYTGNGIRIGNGVLIAANCTLAPVNHEYRLRNKTIIEQRFMPSKGGITIEDDVWIAANAMVLKGVTIGRCSIVAAGSVVTKDVPPNVIVAGNPSRIVRKIP